MAIPSRVVSIDGHTAVVESMGVQRTTSLMLMTEEVAVGDYLVLGAGGNFAQDKVPEGEAREAIAYLSQVLEQGLA
jgi:hydrogenase expression/formation protein HypC